MREMRVIDLLNLISRGKWEKLPKKFRYYGKIEGYDAIFVWDDDAMDYVCVNDEEEPWIIGILHLNDIIVPLKQ